MIQYIAKNGVYILKINKFVLQIQSHHRNGVSFNTHKQIQNENLT